jgi:dipeptidyl aminopeptidase/acylaminoacyl peptidase
VTPRIRTTIAATSLSLLLTLSLSISGAFAAEAYRTPPAPLGDIIDAPPTPAVSLSPDHERALLIEYPSMISIGELAEPEQRLGGLRIKPATNGPSRIRYVSKLTFKEMVDLSERVVTGIPADGRIAWASWAPDGSRIAFTVTRDSRFELWTADAASGKAERLDVGGPLNAAGTRPFAWLSDSRTLIAAIVPPDRGAAPPAPTVPEGPVIQENVGKKAPARTYQDLLRNPHDEALFEHYLSARLVRVAVGGEARPMGGTRIVWGFEPSPDGRYVLVESLHRPFSYLVPASRFPRKVEVLDLDGKVVREIVDLPLKEEVPTAFGSVPTGPRSFGWRSDAPSTLTWAEAQDGGDARAEAEVRDKLFTLDAPFDGEPVELASLGLRYGGVSWGTDKLALVYEWWWKTRNVRAWMVQPGEPASEAELLWDHNWEDRYNDPGDPVSRTNEWGRSVLHLAAGGKRLFLIGDGASPEGDRPFFDVLDLKTRKTERLFRSEKPHYERPVLPLDDKASKVLVRRESVEQPPNYYVRDMKSGDLRAITTFPHPSPQLEGLSKEMIRYERDDGVKMTATLYLPPAYEKERGPLPTLVWAYPQEFKSADAAGQVTDSPYRFDRVGWWSPLLFLTQGFAVLDDPTMPIIGEGDEEPNDTYVEQLVSSAKAAVDEAVRRGVTDRNRVAIGGHSYGAFMTANLLAHSDIFRAGIARSGAYNRTLTPFGFQAEERTVWEAPEVYFKMSPFMHAEKVNEPLLLIHGDADNNSGTYPMQSERFYNALKGLGATARLVMLPHESHGYRARESVHHMLWEMAGWLDAYVKNAPPRGEVAPEAPVGGGPR